MKTRIEFTGRSSSHFSPVAVLAAIVGIATIGLGAHTPPAPAGSALLAKYLAAAGGEAKWRAVSRLSCEGIHKSTAVMPFESPSVFRFAYPSGFQSLAFAHPSNALGNAIVTTAFGKTAWIRGYKSLTTGPVTDATGLSPSERSALHLRRSALQWAIGVVPSRLVDAGVITLTDGPRVSEGTRELATATVADEAGAFGKLFFWSDTGLPARFEFRYMMLIGRPTEGRRVSVFDDYRLVEGIRLPFSWSLDDGGELISVSGCQVNPPFTSDVFREPLTGEQLNELLSPLKRKRGQ